VQWYLEVLRKYTEFTGRGHRTEFWMFTLWSLVVSVALAVVDIAVGTDGEYVGLFSGIYTLLVLLPTLAVGARRLHDIGRTGWWQLLAFIPLVGIIILIIWWAQPGVAPANEHGPNPWDGPRPL